jgi:drug/metabolite transporter (DMT)-like permease
MDPRRRSLIGVNMAVVLWAITAMFAKWIALPTYQITGLRSVVAAAALYAVLRWQRQPLGTTNRRDLWLLLVGGFALGAHWVTYFESIRVSTVAIGILSLHTYPVLTALAEPLVFGERLRAVDVALAGLVFAGVGVLVPEFSLDSSITRGVLLGLASAACFAARNLLTRRAVAIYGAPRVMFYQLLGVALALFPPAIGAGQPVSIGSAGQVLLLGVLFTALPHTLYTSSLAHLKARSAGIMATLLPVYGSLAAAVFLGEVPSTRTLVGGAIIVLAVALETVRVLRRPSTAAGPAARS